MRHANSTGQPELLGLNKPCPHRLREKGCQRWHAARHMLDATDLILGVRVTREMVKHKVELLEPELLYVHLHGGECRLLSARGRHDLGGDKECAAIHSGRLDGRPDLCLIVVRERGVNTAPADTEPIQRHVVGSVRASGASPVCAVGVFVRRGWNGQR